MDHLGTFFKGLDKEMRESHLKALRQILEPRPEIVYAYVFGSFLSGFPFQDIDLALYLDLQQRENAQNLEEHYASLLDDAFGELFDILIINKAPYSLLCSVFREGRLLFCKDEDLLSGLIEACSLERIANEALSRQSLEEIVS